MDHDSSPARNKDRQGQSKNRRQRLWPGYSETKGARQVRFVPMSICFLRSAVAAFSGGAVAPSRKAERSPQDQQTDSTSCSRVPGAASIGIGS